MHMKEKAGLAGSVVFLAAISYFIGLTANPGNIIAQGKGPLN